MSEGPHASKILTTPPPLLDSGYLSYLVRRDIENQILPFGTESTFAQPAVRNDTPSGAAQRFPLLNQAGPTQKALPDTGSFIEPELV